MPPSGGGVDPSGTGATGSSGAAKKTSRGLFADVLAGKKAEKSVDIDEMKEVETKSYKLPRMPPNSIVTFLRNKFKSLAEYNWNSALIRGNPFFLITIGFSPKETTKEIFDSDLKEAQQFSIEINGRKIVFEAIDKEELDKDGSIVPRMALNLIIKNFPKTLAKAPELIRKALEKYVTFNEVLEVKLVKEDGIYMGKAVIPVKEFKKQAPPKRFQMPMVYFKKNGDMKDEDGEYVAEENCFQEVFLQPLGFDRVGEKKVEPAPEPVKYCTICTADDHVKWKCPKFKKKPNNNNGKFGGYTFRCPHCKRNDYGCERKENRLDLSGCKNAEDIKNGKFNFSKPKEKKTREGASSSRLVHFGGETESMRSTPLKAKRSRTMAEADGEQGGWITKTSGKGKRKNRFTSSSIGMTIPSVLEEFKDGYGEDKLNQNHINFKNPKSNENNASMSGMSSDEEEAGNTEVPESRGNQDITTTPAVTRSQRKQIGQEPQLRK